jgi:hypothetical protein
MSTDQLHSSGGRRAWTAPTLKRPKPSLRTASLSPPPGRKRSWRALRRFQWNETAYNVRDRLQAQERSISGQITGLNTALEQARLGNDEKSAYNLLQALKSAREEHRRQADSLLKAEGRIILLEKNRGDLISVSAAREFVSKTIIPLTIWLRKFVEAGRNSEEKTLREAGLEILRVSAAEAANFNGKEALA